MPFSVYLGWITVATIANATAFLVKAGWNGFGVQPAVWTVAVIVVAALVTLAVLLTRRDIAYSFVVFVAAVAYGAVVAAAIIASVVRSALKPLKA